MKFPLRLRPAFLPLLLLLAAAPLRAVDFFVATNGNDTANDGKSAAKPFRNIARAVVLATAPGDTVTVAAGTYTETISLVRTGTAAAPIVFRSVSRGAAKIVGGVRILTNYIDFVGFDVANPSSQGINVSGHHVRVLNNDVHDCFGNGISAFSFDYLTIEGNRLYNNGLENYIQAGGVFLFQALAVDQAPGFHIVVRGNHVFNNVSNNQARNNNFTIGTGIYIDDFRQTLDGSTAGPYRPATLIENNLIYGNTARAIVITKSDNLTVRHNTAYNNLPTRNTNTTLGDFTLQDTDRVTWVNNILISRGAPLVAIYDSRNTNAVWDYNIVSGGVITLTDGTTSTLGAHNYLVDPRLVAPASADFRPGPGSVALDTGLAAQGASVDFDGVARPIGPGVDIGAYEAKADTTTPAGLIPTLAAQPQNRTALSGAIVSLSVTPEGSPPLSFQWSRNGVAIAGATAAAFTLSPLKVADAGSYTVKVTNATGSVTSNAATLSVASTPSFAWRNPSPEGGSWFAVRYAAGKFVAVGAGGRIISSTDGLTWALAATVTSTALRGLIHDGFQWVAVGDGGGVFTSPNATTWTQRTSATNQTLYSIIYVNGQFVASGAAGVVVVSLDGINWALRTTGVTQNLYSIAGTVGSYVAVGQTGVLLTSPDTFTWTRVTLPNVIADFNAIAQFSGQFIALGNSGIIYTSADAVTWTSRGTTTITNGLRAIAFNGSQFVITTDGDRVVVTSNFATYTSLNLAFNPTTPHWSVASSPTMTVAVGAGGEIASSPDSLTWTRRGTDGTRWEQRGLAFLNAQWFVVGSNTGIFTSPDGVSWLRLPIPAANWLNTIGYAAGRYIAIGDQGYITTSVDAVTWAGNTTASGTTQSLRGIASTGGLIVVAGYGGTLRTSTNGTTWTAATSGITSNLNALTAFGNRFIAVGDSGVILTSTNGTTWTPATSGTTQNLRGLCVDGGTVYVVGSGRTILASTDGQTWTPRTAPSLNNSNYRGIAAANGGLLIVGDQGVALFSVDSVTWSYLPALAYNETLLGVASNGLSTVICTTGGGILQSGNPSAISSRLINVATRGLVQPGGSLTPGFVLRGTGSKQVVVRAIGPTLAGFGLTALTDLKLDVVNQQTNTIASTNDDWGGSATLTNAFASLGAFPLAAASSKDAAVQASLPVNSGGYSVKIVPSGTGTTGVALAEVYDADPDDSPVRVVNVSTLGYVGTGENVLTPGFVIRGTVPKLVLIRAIGPGLAQLGVGGLLADPQFSVFPAGSNLALVTNNDWGANPAVKAAMTAAGAFTIPDTSKDAALVATLPPGGYTIVTSGVGSTTGTALVEVYDLDP